jgi:hypothetical protein
MSENREMTYGEKAVGLTFNPSNDDVVGMVKVKFSDILDELNDLREGSHDAEMKRMFSIAITEAQTAQMWAVKAITWKF